MQEKADTETKIRYLPVTNIFWSASILTFVFNLFTELLFFTVVRTCRNIEISECDLCDWR